MLLRIWIFCKNIYYLMKYLFIAKIYNSNTDVTDKIYKLFGERRLHKIDYLIFNNSKCKEFLTLSWLYLQFSCNFWLDWNLMTINFTVLFIFSIHAMIKFFEGSRNFDFMNREIKLWKVSSIYESIFFNFNPIVVLLIQYSLMLQVV